MTDKGKVEAALFAAGHPLTVREIAEKTGILPSTVRQILKDLASEFRERGGAITVTKLGSKWSMHLDPAYVEEIPEILPANISKELLKTAALIAYHQPVLQSELQSMVGARVYDQVKSLRELGLIRTRPKGRSVEIVTTSAFPEFFGIDAGNREEIKKWMAQRIGVLSK